MKKIDAPEKVIFICDGKKCGRYSKELYKSFKRLIKEHGLKHDVELTCMQCTNNCKTAPNICLQPQNAWLGEVEEKDVKDIFKKYIV
ncbi:(2Fe-2S) ferredoxin domain-containing protein [Flavobacterium sp. MFBS3-15]|uniref:(2Fe-2S) ferredoxin domain-containing protein n=1 Tax=Flavobacterium sp. MFBS3-15 TaxID=2989816 RepID=UPI0022369675|nr:(2Fe-2S) ferredoxin domain-containing protein [Flavobacterium sp. MFBS3-15]MCW4468488.1 (2Fe-2S) ferredoxin domain-containing protein [Flavobacterium sp. MFBS3-15]